MFPYFISISGIFEYHVTLLGYVASKIKIANFSNIFNKFISLIKEITKTM